MIKNGRIVLSTILIITLMLFNGCASSSTNTEESQPVDNKTEASKDEVSEENNNTSCTDEYIYIGEEQEFLVTEKAIKFLDEHSNIFPSNDLSLFSEYVDSNITFQMLNKNISKYGDKLIEIPYSYVTDIQESPDGTLSYIHVVDENMNNYVIYYFGSLDNIFDESEVQIYGLPLDIITFENMGGAYTEAVVLAGVKIDII